MIYFWAVPALFYFQAFPLNYGYTYFFTGRIYQGAQRHIRSNNTTMPALIRWIFTAKRCAVTRKMPVTTNEIRLKTALGCSAKDCTVVKGAEPSSGVVYRLRGRYKEAVDQ
jgi:hypothetical protein